MLLAHISDGLEVCAMDLTPLRNAFCLQRLDFIDQELLLNIELFVAVFPNALKLSKIFGM